MAQWHGISRRKSTGGRRVPSRGKRSTEISSEKQFAFIGEITLFVFFQITVVQSTTKMESLPLQP
jgi:ribosomal protein S8E